MLNDMGKYSTLAILALHLLIFYKNVRKNYNVVYWGINSDFKGEWCL